MRGGNLEPYSQYDFEYFPIITDIYNCVKSNIPPYASYESLLKWKEKKDNIAEFIAMIYVMIQNKENEEGKK